MPSLATPVDVADIEFLSPYLTSHIKRFGDFKLNLERMPDAWIRDCLFAGPAHAEQGRVPTRSFSDFSENAPTRIRRHNF